MNRIERKFQQLSRQKRKALIPFLAAGDPSISLTKALIREVEEQGADIIELGIPFSDPLADGPTIQKAYLRGLKNGVTLQDVLKLVKEVRQESEIPIVIMSYYNLIFKMGLEEFVQGAREVGVDGVIVPDLPPEEGETFHQLATREGLATIFLVAPNSPPERISKIAQKTRGFLYYVSLMGVTGERKALAPDLIGSLQTIRSSIQLPLVVGFGISTPEHVRLLAPWVDGIVVGSALIRVIENNLKDPALLREVGRFVAQLKSAT